MSARLAYSGCLTFVLTLVLAKEASSQVGIAPAGREPELATEVGSRWPPHPADIVHQWFGTRFVPASGLTTIYVVPDDCWLVVRYAVVEGGSAALVEESGGIRTTKAIVFHLRDRRGGGAVFRPGSLVRIQNVTSIDDLLAGFINGYKVPIAPVQRSPVRVPHPSDMVNIFRSKYVTDGTVVNLLEVPAGKYLVLENLRVDGEHASIEAGAKTYLGFLTSDFCDQSGINIYDHYGEGMVFQPGDFVTATTRCGVPKFKKITVEARGYLVDYP